MKNLAFNKFNKARAYTLLCIGIALMAVFAIFAIIPEKIAPYSPTQSFETFLGCSSEHLLGTNNLGYDIFSEMVFATRSTLLVGLLSALIALGVGALIGVLAGYIGGFAGEAVNGFINFFLLVPMLPLAIVIAAYLGAGQQNIILTIAILGWCGTARAVRAKTLKLRNMPFVESMKVLGYSRWRILFRHLLPNTKDVIFSKYISSVATCILLEATLGFLGLGDVSNVTWGGMINLAYKYGGLARGAYNWFLAPGLCIMLLVLSFYFINAFLTYKSESVKGGGSLD